jgi:hypothetical protein
MEGGCLVLVVKAEEKKQGQSQTKYPYPSPRQIGGINAVDRFVTLSLTLLDSKRMNSLLLTILL